MLKVVAISTTDEAGVPHVRLRRPLWNKSENSV